MITEIKIVSDVKTAIRIGQFMTGNNTFDQTWAPNEKKHLEQAPIDSLSNKNHRYWYVEDKGEIVGAIGVRENKYNTGGYELDADYLAVHRKYRNLGIATNLLKTAEKFVAEKHGRYIHILACDIDSYKPARQLYEKNGYKKVADIPDYYLPGEGRVDYFKQITT
jgi:ribosomal protein S18 acetylase RimI-like enzyme